MLHRVQSKFIRHEFPKYLLNLIEFRRFVSNFSKSLILGETKCPPNVEQIQKSSKTKTTNASSVISILWHNRRYKMRNKTNKLGSRYTFIHPHPEHTYITNKRKMNHSIYNHFYGLFLCHKLILSHYYFILSNKYCRSFFCLIPSNVVFSFMN